MIEYTYHMNNLNDHRQCPIGVIGIYEFNAIQK